MKIKGLRSTIRELRRVESNNNFARIYVDNGGNVFVCEYTDHISGRYNSDDAIQIMTYDGRVICGEKYKTPTMAEIKSAAEKAIFIRDEMLIGLDFTEEDYNNIASDGMATFDGFINNAVKIVMDEGGTVEDAIFIANDAFRQVL